MKRYGNIYSGICDVDNIKTAILCASKGKRQRRDVKKILRNIDSYAVIISNMLKNHTYKPSPYLEAAIFTGTNHKPRIIHKPHFYPDQIVHWAIHLQIAHILQKSFYEYSCGSVPGKGPHYGKRAIERWLKTDRKRTKYYLKIDVRRYYPSIQPERVKAVLRNKFKDKELLELLDSILDLHTGMPIGILLSQWLGNYFLTPLDHKIKQDFGAAYYIRYMDDMVIFGSNKRELHKTRMLVAVWLNENGLEMKDNWQVCRTDKEPLDFMGFRFYRGYTTIRKSILYRMTRKARRIYKYGITQHRASGMISYLGYISCTNSYRLYKTRIEPYINIGALKDAIRGR